MNSIIEIEALMKKGDKTNIVANIFYNLMTNLHQPYSELLNMPIPMALELLKILEQQNKEMEKQMKKGGKRW